MNEEKPPKLSRIEVLSIWIQRIAVVVVGLISTVIAFLCCCTSSYLVLGNMIHPELDLLLRMAVILGLVAGALACVFTIRRLWPRD